LPHSGAIADQFWSALAKWWNWWCRSVWYADDENDS